MLMGLGGMIDAGYAQSRRRKWLAGDLIQPASQIL
jgi:hypothetical protein